MISLRRAKGAAAGMAAATGVEVLRKFSDSRAEASKGRRLRHSSSPDSNSRGLVDRRKGKSGLNGRSARSRNSVNR